MWRTLSTLVFKIISKLLRSTLTEAHTTWWTNRFCRLRPTCHWFCQSKWNQWVRWHANRPVMNLSWTTVSWTNHCHRRTYRSNSHPKLALFRQAASCFLKAIKSVANATSFTFPTKILFRSMIVLRLSFPTWLTPIFRTNPPPPSIFRPLPSPKTKWSTKINRSLFKWLLSIPFRSISSQSPPAKTLKSTPSSSKFPRPSVFYPTPSWQ